MNKIVKLHYRAKKFKKIPFIAILIKRYIRVIYGCEIPLSCSIDPTVNFAHNGLGVVINSSAKIGEGTTIYQNVTIGNKKSSKGPQIGKNVLIGAGAVVIGDIKIGDGAKIGAGAIVVKDVPENCTVVSPSAQIIR